MIDRKASELHFSSLVVDAHSDSIARTVYGGEDLARETGRGHMDLPRMRTGGVSAQFFAVGSDPRFIRSGQSIRHVLDQIDALLALCASHPDEIRLASTANDVRRNKREGRLSAIMCLEGGHSIDDDLAVLRVLHGLGVRYMSLTWNNSHNWADGVLDEPRHGGLSGFGRQVVGEMERLGMMVDISHSSVSTFWDVMEVATRPVIASHSSALEVCGHPRNLANDQLRALAENGGVACVNFECRFVSERYRLDYEALYKGLDAELTDLQEVHAGDRDALEEASEVLQARYRERRTAELELPSYLGIVDHIEHMARVAGIDHVGLGSDFDGCTTPEGMEDCTSLPRITTELLRRGYSDGDVRKVLGENLLRVMEEAIGE